jgi:PAS domain S-box-containing protein
MVGFSSPLTCSDDLGGLRSAASRVLDESDASGAHNREVLLVLNELATNALMHARGPYHATLVVEKECAVVLVTDGGGGKVEVRDAAGGDGGYGLRLADAIAQSWGCASGLAGKTVWAVIAQDRERAGDGEERFSASHHAPAHIAALAALEHSRLQLEAAQRLAHLGTFDFDLVTGTLSFSDEMHRICGLDPTREHVRELADVLQLLDEREAMKIPDLIERAQRSHSPIEEEFNFRRPDGEIRIAALLIETVTNAEGHRICLRGTALDVTAQRHNELDLLMHRRALEEAQRLARLGSWHYDLVAGTTLWSAQMFSLFGLDPADGPMPFGRWQERVHPDDADVVRDARRQVLRHRRAFSYEARMLNDEDAEWFAAVEGEPILDDAGAVSAVHGTIQDITDRRAAERALIASEAARAVEQSAIEALQRSVLPAAMPSLDDLQLSARYEPAGRGAMFGGDWYDAYLVPDGRVVIALGDVAGHGLGAVAMAAQLRNASRAYMIQNDSPALTLTALDQLVHQLYPDDMATMILGIYEPRRGSLTLARAGHPHPVVHTPGTRAAVLEIAGGLPLGAGHAARIPYQDVTVAVPHASRLVLYSDGCIEQRGRSLADGIAQLLPVVSDAGDLDDLCDRVVAIQTASAEDDRCVLALHRSGPNT